MNTHELCLECNFDGGQHFLVLITGVWRLCNVHICEYAQIYCADCDLYHLEPDVTEICSWVKRKFLDLDCSDDSDSSDSSHCSGRRN